MVRHESAKLLCTGSSPVGASNYQTRREFRVFIFMCFCGLERNMNKGRFVTLYLSNHMNEKIPRLLYGIDAVIIILFNQFSAELLKKDNPALLDYLVSIRKAVARDIPIKIVGIIVGAVVWPQAVLVSVFVSMVILAVFFFKTNANS